MCIKDSCSSARPCTVLILNEEFRTFRGRECVAALGWSEAFRSRIAWSRLVVRSIWLSSMAPPRSQSKQEERTISSQAQELRFSILTSKRLESWLFSCISFPISNSMARRIFSCLDETRLNFTASTFETFLNVHPFLSQYLAL